MLYTVRIEVDNPYRLIEKELDSYNPMTAIKDVLVSEGVIKCSELCYDKILSISIFKIKNP